ncbi:MAG: DUF1990 domain-containing protein [Magnetococcales bacterium]|nr:DUF1990 domain-containing protein [Magnetococcales bacterium]
MNFQPRKPSPTTVANWLTHVQNLSFTYPEVGRSRQIVQPTLPMQGYQQFHLRVPIGQGAALYEQAREAFIAWRMFDLHWVHLCLPPDPWQEGSSLIVLGRSLGLWWPNASRIIYTLNEQTPHLRRLGFAYGTLTGNMARGEERFLLEWDPEKETTYYDFYSFSCPNGLLSHLGAFHLRQLQERFMRESAQSLIRGIGGTTT